MALVQVQASPAEAGGATARRSLSRLLFSGSSVLGAATVLERGFGFLANLAAARLAGAHTFGAYSLAMTTANSVASYAGAGIGITANRFSGEYPYGSGGYPGLVRSLSIISLGSSALAVVALWFTARPLATHLLGNADLTSLLHWASLSAGVIIFLECLRGLLIGQRRFAALLALSLLVGGGMISLLPLAATRGPAVMVTSQASAVACAIVICLLLARRLQFWPARGTIMWSAGPRPGKILRFGLVQLTGTIGFTAAGWWIASLVSRADHTLVQIAWYSVATQMRNMCAMPSWLISETAYAHLTEHGGREYGGAGRVTVFSTIAATAVSLLVAGIAIALMPWVMPHFYGHDYAGAEFAASIAITTGMVHMSAAPAAARLTAVSLPLTTIVNGAWTVVVVALGIWLVPKGGAAAAATSFLGAHIFSAITVLISLISLGAAPRKLAVVSLPLIIGSLLFAGLGWMRSVHPNKLALSGAMIAVTACLFGLIMYLGLSERTQS